MAETADNRHSAYSPEALLESYLAGDDGAFGELVARYESRLFAFAARMTGDDRLAGDIFRKTFVNVAKNAASFNGGTSFAAWLYRIAGNAALDELRRRSRRRGEPAGDASAVPPGDEPAATAGDLSEQVRRALALLPEEQREAFLLKEEGDLNFEETGVALGCGRETAKSLFRLAAGKLRSLLGLENAHV